MHKIFKFILLLPFLLLISNPSKATVRLVDDLGYTTTMSGGTQTLYQAIGASSAGDTILIDISGTMLVFGPNLVIDKPLTIIGPTAKHFTIDANGFEVQLFSGGASDFINISGVRFINSACPCGPFLSIAQNVTVRMTDCVFENLNTGTSGGAIRMLNNAKLEANNISFIGCISNAQGGAVFVDAGNEATFKNCTFFNNSASNAGGAVCSLGKTTFVNNTFLNNTSSTNQGHAIADENIAAGTDTKIQNNIFTDGSSLKYANLISGSISNLIASSGGNIFSTLSPPSFIATGPKDLFNIALGVIGLRPTPVNDGYGLIYFPIISQTGLAVDNGVTASLPISDCRRAPRTLYGDNALLPDAGACEFSPFRITSVATASFVTMWNNMNSSSFPGTKYMDFDMGGTAVFSIGTSLSNSASPSVQWVVDGFTQDGSAVPGPGSTPGSFTPGNYLVNINIATGTLINLNNPGIGSFLSGLWLDNGSGVGISCTDGVLGIYGNHVISSTASGLNGISLSGSLSSFIGGKYHYRRNVISNQNNSVASSGISVNSGAVASIEGNFIGTNALGSTALPNAIGVSSNNASVTIGGNYLRQNRNVISGNNNHQIEIGTNSLAKIFGNIIGLDASQTSVLSSSATGINVLGNTNGEIGSEIPGLGNVICGQGTGIVLSSSNQFDVKGNFIGLANKPGFTSFPNGTGISIIGNGSNSHMIGENSLGGRNYIAYNTSMGIFIDNASGHSIKGNFIGVDPNNASAGNGNYGIHVVSSSSGMNIDGNLISNHTINGINYNGAGFSDIISNNKIGTDSTGSVAMANNEGISITGSSTLSITNNLVSGNSTHGIFLSSAAATIQGNTVGMNLLQNAALPNNIGIYVETSTGVTIQNNTISGNIGNGIHFAGSGDCYVRGNYIGTTSAGLSFGNNHGISCYFNSNSITIGGSVATDYNTIAFNNLAGIDIQAEPVNVGIFGNYFFNNFAHAITFNAATNPALPWLNDVNDVDVSGVTIGNAGNFGQNYPENLAAVYNGASTTVGGSMNVDNVTANYRIQVYKVLPGNIEASGHGEGDTLLASQVFNAGGLNTFSFTIPVTGLNLGDVVSATCTKEDAGFYNTSEFSDTALVKSAFSATASVVQHPTCFGFTDGIVNVTHGGTPAFTYQWFDAGTGSPVTGGTSATLSSVAPGSYYCVVTDGMASVVTSDTVTVIAPPQIIQTNLLTNPTCNGGSDGQIVITASNGATSYYEYSIDGGFTFISVNNTFTGLPAGTYEIWVRDANTCYSVIDTVILTSPAPITYSLIPTSESCIGEGNGSANLTVTTGATGPLTYNFYTSTSTLITSVPGIAVGTSGVCANMTPGSYYVEIVDALGCLDTVTFTISPSTNFINGAFVTSSPSCITTGTGFAEISTSSPATTTWLYDFGDGNTSPFQNPTWVYASPGTYTVTLVVSNGFCDDTVSHVVIVDSIITVNVINNDTSLCSTGVPSIALNATVSGPTSLLWSTSGIGTFTSTTSLTPDYFFSGADVVSGSVTLYLTSGASGTCPGSVDSVVITFVNPPTVNAGVDQSLCSGTPFNLSGSAAGASTTNWTNGAGTYGSGSTSLVTTYLPTTTESLGGGVQLVLVATSALGCSAKDTIDLTILTSPVANAGADASICSGSFSLDAASSTGTITSYLWEQVGGTVVGTTSTVSVSPTITTSYALTVSNGVCSDQDTITITVGTPPDPSVSYSDAIYCENEVIGPAATVVTVGGTFTTSSASLTVNPTTGAIDPGLSTDGVYQVYYTLTSPCFAIDSATITIHARPVVSITPDHAACYGDTVTLVGTPAGGTWTGIGITGYATFNTIVAGLGFKTIAYTYNDPVTGCSGLDTNKIFVHALPSVNFSGLTGPYCIADGPFVLTGSPSGGGFWLNGVFQGISSFSYDPATIGIDSIIYVYQDPVTTCANFNYQLAVVLNGPPAPVTSTVTNFCESTPGSVSVSNPSTNVLWYSDAALTNLLDTGITISSSVLPAGTNTIYVVNDNGTSCVSVATPFTYTLYDASMVDLGGPYTICSGEQVTLSPTLPAFTTLAWNADSTLNDTTIVNPIASPTSTTTYFVDILFSVPACIVSDSVVVTVNPCSLENITNVFTPDGDGVNDTWIIEGINAYPDNTVVVFNRWGSRLIELKGYDNATVVWDGKYNGAKVASGTYYFVIELHGEGQQRSGWVQVNY